MNHDHRLVDREVADIPDPIQTYLGIINNPSNMSNEIEVPLV